MNDISWKRGVALACSVATTGRVPSVDDVVPPSEPMFDPGLLGVWIGTWEAGVMRTPTLGIDGHLVLQGRVPGVTELASIIKKAAVGRP